MHSKPALGGLWLARGTEGWLALGRDPAGRPSADGSAGGGGRDEPPERPQRRAPSAPTSLPDLDAGHKLVWEGGPLVRGCAARALEMGVLGAVPLFVVERFYYFPP